MITLDDREIAVEEFAESRFGHDAGVGGDRDFFAAGQQSVPYARHVVRKPERRNRDVADIEVAAAVSKPVPALADPAINRAETIVLAIEFRFGVAAAVFFRAADMVGMRVREDYVHVIGVCAESGKALLHSRDRKSEIDEDNGFLALNEYAISGAAAAQYANFKTHNSYIIALKSVEHKFFDEERKRNCESPGKQRFYRGASIRRKEKPVL